MAKNYDHVDLEWQRLWVARVQHIAGMIAIAWLIARYGEELAGILQFCLFVAALAVVIVSTLYLARLYRLRRDRARLRRLPREYPY